jgi:hypothetical protein
MTWGPTQVVRPSERRDVPKRGQVGKRAAGAPRMPFAVLVTVLIVGGLALLLLLNTVSAANEVRRHDITARDASIAAQVQELQNEVAASAAPGNLAQAAAALGMVPAMNPAFLVVASDGTVRVFGSPAAVSPVVVAQQPRRHASSTRTPSKSASPTSSKSSTDHPANSHTSTSSTPTPSPSPTPTPTLTLPGGNR